MLTCTVSIVWSYYLGIYICMMYICDHYVAKFAVKCHDLSYFGVICGSGSGSGSGLCSKIKK